MRDRSDSEKEEDIALKKYLEGLKLKGGEGDKLVLPGEDLPRGFDFKYYRCYRRTIYSHGPFNIVVSKAVVYRSGGKDLPNPEETVRITFVVPNSFTPLQLIVKYFLETCDVQYPFRSRKTFMTDAFKTFLRSSY